MISPSKVLAFILTCFLAVVAMSVVFQKSSNPKGELCLDAKGETCIKYFTLQDMLGYEAYKSNALIAIAKQMELEEKEAYEKKLMESISSLADSIVVEEKIADKDSTRFWLPEGDRKYWEELFAQWEKLAENKKLFRILHYGDSQIEMDRITAYIREKLQSKFGGGGPGLLPPLQLVPSYTIQQTSSENWKRLVSYGTSNDRAEHNRYGVSGMLFKFDSTYASVGIAPRYKNKNPYLQKFETAKVIIGATEEKVGVSISYGKGSNTQVLKPSTRSQMIKWNFDTAQSRFHFSFSGDSTTDVLGIAIDAKWGIAMDNIAWRGSSGLTFTSISRNSLTRTYKFLDVKMVIMQFGGNSVPYMKDDKAIARYVNSFGKQIDYIKSIDSTIKIMVIGPADMSVNDKGEMVTHPMLEELIKQMRIVSNQKGAAFWSMYHAMGGYNSMTRWVKSDPALGAPDYIHFSQKGAREMAIILNRAIFREYEIYLKKKRMEETKGE